MIPLIIRQGANQSNKNNPAEAKDETFLLRRR